MTRRVVSIATALLLLAGLVLALVVPARGTAVVESSYILCAGIGDPVDSGVCVPAPYPERLPLDRIPV